MLIGVEPAYKLTRLNQMFQDVLWSVIWIFTNIVSDKNYKKTIFKCCTTMEYSQHIRAFYKVPIRTFCAILCYSLYGQTLSLWHFVKSWEYCIGVQHSEIIFLLTFKTIFRVKVYHVSFSSGHLTFWAHFLLPH